MMGGQIELPPNPPPPLQRKLPSKSPALLGLNVFEGFHCPILQYSIRNISPIIVGVFSNTEAYLGPSRTSTVELFAKIVSR